MSAAIALPKGCKPHLCCSADETRPHLLHGFLRKYRKSWWVCATDSYLAVAIKADVEDGEPVPGVIPVAALKLLGTSRKLIQVDDRSWKVDGADGQSTQHSVGDTVPDPAKLSFNKLGVWKKPKPAEAVEPFGINPDFVSNFGSAVGGHGLRVTMLGPLKGVHVAAIGHERERVGLILPIRLHPVGS